MTSGKKLSVFILSNDDLTSNLIFAPLFESDQIDVKGLAFTTTLTGKQGGIRGIFKLLEKVDVRYWLYLAFTNGCFRIFEKLALWTNAPLGTLPSLKQACRQSDVPVYYSGNFNSQAFLERVKQAKPDILVIRVNQILKQPILDIPSLGVWCVHSSLLPSYRGIAAEFHALNNHEAYIGTSIFKVLLKLDEGPVIRQNAIAVEPGRSVFHLMLRNNREAAALLRETLETLAERGEIEPMQPPADTLEPSYYSWPSTEQVRSFHAQGKRLIALNECLSFMATCLHLKSGLTPQPERLAIMLFCVYASVGFWRG